MVTWYGDGDVDRWRLLQAGLGDTDCSFHLGDNSGEFPRFNFLFQAVVVALL